MGSKIIIKQNIKIIARHNNTNWIFQQNKHKENNIINAKEFDTIIELIKINPIIIMSIYTIIFFNKENKYLNQNMDCLMQLYYNHNNVRNILVLNCVVKKIMVWFVIRMLLCKIF